MPRQVPWRAVAECVLAFATGSRAEAAEHAPIRKPLVAARSRASRVAVAAAPCRDGAKRAVAVHACRARHAQRRTQREHRSPTVGRRRHAPAPLRRSTPCVACHGSCRKLRRASAQRLLAARPCGTPRGARTGCITLPRHASRATACSRRVRQSRARKRSSSRARGASYAPLLTWPLLTPAPLLTRCAACVSPAVMATRAPWAAGGANVPSAPPPQPEPAVLAALHSRGGELLPDQQGVRVQGWRVESTQRPIMGREELHRYAALHEPARALLTSASRLQRGGAAGRARPAGDAVRLDAGAEARGERRGAVVQRPGRAAWVEGAYRLRAQCRVHAALLRVTAAR